MNVKQFILVALVVVLTAFATYDGGWKWERPGNGDQPGHVDH